MALVLQKLGQGYWFLFEELPDPRTKTWPLVAKPYQGLIIVALYLMFVIKWGPQWMKNRQPFKLDKLMIVYNAIQVIACGYIFINALRKGWWKDYKWLCEPVDFSDDPKALEIAKLTYLYYMLKIIDLSDTVFFVLRKKHSQISFLHIYHHAGMVMLIWGSVTYLPGGHGTLIGVINSFVHVVMYSYYLLTVAIPSFKNAIWFKKLVTQLQIVQFFWYVVHMGALVFKTDCEYPRWTAAVFLPQNVFMLLLFLDFYIRMYVKKPQQKLSASAKLNNGSQNNNDVKNKTDKINSNGNGINKLNAGISKVNDIDDLNNNEFNIGSNVENGKGKIPYVNSKNVQDDHHKRA